MQFATEKEYREDNAYINQSAVKEFNVCPNLYHEHYVLKTYTPPEKDHFIYGLLVDCLLTTPDELHTRYVRVDAKLDPADLLKYEVKIKELEAEMSVPDDKGESMRDKAARGHKTAAKGIAKREGEVEAYAEKVRIIKSLGDKKQITAGMWDNAHETAEVIKQNPGYQKLAWNPTTSQQILVDMKTKRKAILDHLYFSDSAQKIWNLYVTGMVDLPNMQKAMLALPEKDRWGVITDIKTTKSISEFEPSQYDTQLAIYQAMVEAITTIKCRCQIIAGDKDSEWKTAQDYEIAQELLDKAYADYLEVEEHFIRCTRDNFFPPAKEVYGKDQECYRCSKCRVRPLSKTDAPILVTGKLFANKYARS